MKLVKTTKKHYIYELNEREKKKTENSFNFLLFAKSDYEEMKPKFDYDLGSQDWETETLKEAIEFSLSE